MVRANTHHNKKITDTHNPYTPQGGLESEGRVLVCRRYNLSKHQDGELQLQNATKANQSLHNNTTLITTQISMAPSQTHCDSVITPDCNPSTHPEEETILISSDEEDNSNAPEVIELSDTERPDEGQDEEDEHDFRTHVEQIIRSYNFPASTLSGRGMGIFRQAHFHPEQRVHEASFFDFIDRANSMEMPPPFMYAMGQDDGFEADMQRAMRASMDDTLSNFGPKNVNHPDPPAKTTEGFTRSVRKKQVVTCALCRFDLGVGIPSEKKSGVKRRKRFSRFSDITEVERTLSKRMFFTKCGHIYCGLCVQFIKRRRTSKQKKADKNSTCEVSSIPDFKGRYIDTPFSLIDTCVVPGCDAKLPQSRGKFFKEMFT